MITLAGFHLITYKRMERQSTVGPTNSSPKVITDHLPVGLALFCQLLGGIKWGIGFSMTKLIFWKTSYILVRLFEAKHFYQDENRHQRENDPDD